MPHPYPWSDDIVTDPASVPSPVYAIKNGDGTVVGLRAGGKRVGSVCLLHYENVAGFAALPASAEQIVGDVVLIPANTLKPGDLLRYSLFSEDAGTADAQVRSARVRINTTSEVLSGQPLVITAVATATNSKLAIDKTIAIVSDTKVKYFPGVAGGSISTTAFINATIDCAVDQYIGLTIQNDNTLVNHLVYQASLTLEAAQ
jgi:hypothetical protein